ncbi:MAG: methionine synthase, partial [Selenomonadaceae bacterium]|nr:methionine synthase [Selenomonadaceae bacterium]
KLRWRFSPGYGDWDLTAQEKLFTISGAEQIGMSLTSAMMLEPRKSITAIIGLKRTADNLQAKKDCATCDKFDCPARK